MEQNSKWNDIWNKIREMEHIKIYRHVNPDPDAYGSQYALAHMIRDNFPHKKIECVGEKVERLSSLYEAFDNDVVEDVDALHVVVDTANIARIDGMHEKVLEEEFVIKIDHHPNLEPYGKIVFVDEKQPATCAILLHEFLQMEKENKATVSNVVLEKLYSGIIGDTGNFSYGIGLNRTFFTNIGIMFERIDTKGLLAGFFAKDIEEVKFKGYLQESIQSGGNDFYFVAFTSKVAEKYGVTTDYATGLVNIMSEIKGARIWASFCEDFDRGEIRCSLRSRTLPISEIAQRHGGGGHPQASGIRVQTWEEVEEIKKEIKEMLVKDDE